MTLSSIDQVRTLSFATVELHLRYLGEPEATSWAACDATGLTLRR